MAADNSSFFEKAYNPLLQAALIFGAVIIVILLSKVIQATGIMEVGERFPWKTAASFMLFYAMFNSIFSLASKDFNNYWGRSMMGFIGLAGASGMAAWFFSSLSIGEAGSFRWIYIVVTVGYLVFLSMMSMMKRIVEFAQKEEWNHPRKRRKRKK